ncbi:hypothetical protein MDAP_000711 [Mitosporidium daphniae]
MKEAIRYLEDTRDPEELEKAQAIIEILLLLQTDIKEKDQTTKSYLGALKLHLSGLPKKKQLPQTGQQDALSRLFTWALNLINQPFAFCASFYGYAKTHVVASGLHTTAGMLKMIVPLLYTWAVSSILDLVFVLIPFTYQRLVTPVGDPISTDVHGFTNGTLSQTPHAHWLYTLTPADKSVLIFGVFFLQVVLVPLGLLLASEPKDANTRGLSAAAVGTPPTKRKWQRKIEATVSFLTSYFVFFDINCRIAVTPLRTIALQLFPGDYGALKKAPLKLSMAVSIFLFSADTLVCLYRNKRLPMPVSFLKQLFGWPTQGDQSGLLAEFVLFIYFTFLGTYIVSVTSMVWFEFWASKAFFSEAMLSLVFFVLYKYAPAFNNSKKNNPTKQS